MDGMDRDEIGINETDPDSIDTKLSVGLFWCNLTSFVCRMIGRRPQGRDKLNQCQGRLTV
jgi:hypothetical protein